MAVIWLLGSAIGCTHCSITGLDIVLSSLSANCLFEALYNQTCAFSSHSCCASLSSNACTSAEQGLLRLSKPPDLDCSTTPISVVQSQIARCSVYNSTWTMAQNKQDDAQTVFWSVLLDNTMVYLPARTDPAQIQTTITSTHTAYILSALSAQCRVSVSVLLAHTYFMPCTTHTYTQANTHVSVLLPQPPCANTCTQVQTTCSVSELALLSVSVFSGLSVSQFCAQTTTTINTATTPLNISVSCAQYTDKQPQSNMLPVSQCVSYNGVLCSSVISRPFYLSASEYNITQHDALLPNTFAEVLGSANMNTNTNANNMCAVSLLEFICNSVFPEYVVCVVFCFFMFCVLYSLDCFVSVCMCRCDTTTFQTTLATQTNEPQNTFPSVSLPRMPSFSLCSSVADACTGYGDVLADCTFVFQLCLFAWLFAPSVLFVV